MIIPIGVEGAQLRRTPWVSISLAVINVLVFFATCGVGDPQFQVVAQRVEAVNQFYGTRQYLEVPKDCGDFIDEDALPPADPAAQRGDVLAEQKQLQQLCNDVTRSLTNRVFASWGLVPGKGILGRGLFTHMFLHGDVMHLMGNMLFLYIVAPILEDVWGMLLFAIFYMLGGMFAGASQASLDKASLIPIIGASGAIAACMGAFTVRFATSRVRMAYWIGLIARGTFGIPAWLWGGLWFAREILAYKLTGTSSGVAVMCHIAGFTLGLVVALVFKYSGLEAHVIAPRVTGERPLTPAQEELRHADAAVTNGDWTLARSHFRRAADLEPDNVAALWGLARAAIALAEPTSAKAIDRLVTRVAQDPQALAEVVTEFDAFLTADLLKPANAKAVGDFLARTNPSRAATFGPSPRTPIRLAPRPVARSGPVLRVTGCRLKARSAAGYLLEQQDGRSLLLNPNQVVGVAAAQVSVTGPLGAAQPMLITDVVLRSDPSTVQVLRFTTVQAGLDRVTTPGTVTPEMHLVWVRELLQLSGAHAWPDKASIQLGSFVSLPDLAAFERALYPQASRVDA